MEQYLIGEIELNGTGEIELNPERCSALKPESLEIRAFDEKGNETWVEILNIVVLGDPQLVNFDGETQSLNRGSSWFFKIERLVNFKTIGSREGQGLYIYLNSDKKVSVYVKIKGSIASKEEIGK